MTYNSPKRNKRLEYVMAQQNGIKEIPPGFLSFNKLKELRIDRNQISYLHHLNHCVSLKFLDASWNELTSLEV
jgi:Leucine-rich repeat (LRR) protein